ncbi:hypothetical protein VTN02DRAFT_5537 [Thermoascus thermophilus]
MNRVALTETARERRQRGWQTELDKVFKKSQSRMRRYSKIEDQATELEAEEEELDKFKREDSTTLDQTSVIEVTAEAPVMGHEEDSSTPPINIGRIDGSGILNHLFLKIKELRGARYREFFKPMKAEMCETFSSITYSRLLGSIGENPQLLQGAGVYMHIVWNPDNTQRFWLTYQSL